MPRQRKTFEARVAEIETKKAQLQTRIDAYKAKLAGLDAKIQKLKDTQKQKELDNLLHVIKSSGKTPEEVIAALDAKKAED